MRGRRMSSTWEPVIHLAGSARKLRKRDLPSGSGPVMAREPSSEYCQILSDWNTLRCCSFSFDPCSLVSSGMRRSSESSATLLHWPEGQEPYSFSLLTACPM